MAKKWPDLNFFELAAGADAVQVAVNKKAEQSTGVVCRPAIFLVLGFKPKFSKVQAIYKEIIIISKLKLLRLFQLLK
jgi:hypothetical protein